MKQRKVILLKIVHFAVGDTRLMGEIIFVLFTQQKSIVMQTGHKILPGRLDPMEVKPMESVVYKQPVWYKHHLSKKKKQETKHPKDKPKKIKSIAERTA